MLEVDNIETYYGECQVLRGISLRVEKGSVVAVVGRNGMGKTTLMRSIIGFTPPRRGKIIFKGIDITHLAPHKIPRAGIALVPQGRRIFSRLSVKENLTMVEQSRKNNKGWTLDKVYSLFPVLKERANLRGNLISGGEQQMLAIGRALMTNPELILMDEPSEGLAPLLVRELGNIIRQLHESGFSVLLVEQNKMALSVADYVYVVNKGTIVYESTPAELERNEEIKNTYLGVA